MTDSSRVRWNDVAGYQSVKSRLEDILDDVHARAGLDACGVPLGGGILIEGLPGCGKSTVARALASGSGRIFTPDQLRGPSVEASIDRLRRAFEEARGHGTVIIVLDDIDVLIGAGMADEATRRLATELRAHLSSAPGDGIFVIGCVKLASSLPSALRRAGRFDHHVSLMPPGPSDRAAIVEHHVATLASVSLAKDVDLHHFAVATPLMTGADLRAITLAAARRAYVPGSESIVIERAHFLTALAHHRRSLSPIEVQRWLDAVRDLPGNEESAIALERDLESHKDGNDELAAMDVSDLLPSQSSSDIPIPRDDDFMDMRTTMVSSVPDPDWDPSPVVARRRQAITRISETQPDPQWDPAPAPRGKKE